MARPHNLERKNEILRLSLKVFSKQVSWDVSLNEVARELKTSTRMLVHHFKTRENLVRECKRSLRESVLTDPSRKAAHSWSQEILQRWKEDMTRNDLDQCKLQVIASLQNKTKLEIKDTESAIENLRELLPSRLKKFAEEIFTYQRGLTLQILTGSSYDRAFKNFQTYLKRLERRSEHS